MPAPTLTAVEERRRRDTVRHLLEQVNQEVAMLPHPVLREFAPALVEAERELARDLRRWVATVKDGNDRFTAQEMRRALVQIRGAMGKVAELAPDLARSLRTGMHRAGDMATRHLTRELTVFSSMFEASLRPVSILTAAQLAGGERLLIPRFRTSAARYVGQVQKDIRHQLAIGVVRGESFFQMTNRLQRLGGPRGRVALKGIDGDPGAVVEHITEGLFARYRNYARRIVATETLNAYNTLADEGIRALHKDDPHLMRRWDAAIDRRLCDVCRALDHNVVGMDENFPGGVDRPPAHPFCRCAVVVWRAGWGEAGEVKFPHGEPKAPPPPPPKEEAPKPRPAALKKPAPAPPPLPLPGAFKHVGEAKAWGERAFPHIAWDFKGAHIDLVNETLVQFEKLAKEWPGVVEKLTAIGTKHTEGTRWGGEWAHFNFQKNAIAINPNKYNNPTTMRQALKRSVELKWNPPGTDNAAAVFTHEFGHAVDHIEFRASHRLGLSPVLLAEGNGTAAEMRTEFLRAVDRLPRVSRYSYEGRDPMAEAWAESFSSIHHTPKDQQMLWAKKHEQFLDAYREKRGEFVHDWKTAPTSRDVSPEARDAAREKIAAFKKKAGL